MQKFCMDADFERRLQKKRIDVVFSTKNLIRDLAGVNPNEETEIVIREVEEALDEVLLRKRQSAAATA